MLLSPYRVLDLTDSRAELATMLFADLGAEVLKIEPPGGAPSRQTPPHDPALPGGMQSLRFLGYNRGKQSVILDLGDPAGRQQFLDLVANADFLFENAPPGAMAARGLGFDDLRTVNPRLIYVAITPFGQDGPYAGHAAADITLAAMGGMMAVNGDRDRPPVRISVPQAWLHAAAESTVGAMIALERRRRTGEAQFVDVAVQPAVHWTMLNASIAAAIQEKDIERLAFDMQLGNRVLRVMFPCTDGDAVIFINGAVLRALVPWMIADGVAPPDWATAEDWGTYDVRWLTGQPLVLSVEQLTEAIARFAALHTKQELLDGGIARGVFLSPSSTVPDTLAFPHLYARDYWQSLKLPDGRTLKAPGPWVRFSATPLRCDGPVPEPGQRA